MLLFVVQNNLSRSENQKFHCLCNKSFRLIFIINQIVLFFGKQKIIFLFDKLTQSVRNILPYNILVVLWVGRLPKNKKPFNRLL